jgi:hypothetical protein
MILPGTYIEVRAEGLIRPGPVSTGNIGIVGTASRGLLGYEEDVGDTAAVYTPVDIGEAREIFGEPDPFGSPNELTLVRALELAFANGASRVFAVRVAEARAARASYQLQTGLTFTARAPGRGYNGATIYTSPYSLVLDITVADLAGTSLEQIGPLSRDDVTAFVAGVNTASTLFTATASSAEAGPIPMGPVVRSKGGEAARAVFSREAATGAVTFTAITGGAAANTAEITVAASSGESAESYCDVTIKPGDGGRAETFVEVPRAADEFVRTINGDHLDYDYTKSSTGAGSALFRAEENGSDRTNVADGDAEPSEGIDAVAAVFEIGAVLQLEAKTPGPEANYWTVSVNGRVDLTINLAGVVETWRDVSTDPATFAAIVNGGHPSYAYPSLASTGGGSNLFSIAPPDGVVQVNENTSAGQTAIGENGAAAANYQAGLDALLTEDVQIVVLAGQGAPGMTSILQGHVQNASTDIIKRERIGVIGSATSAARTDLVAPAQDEGRLVFVGPGIRTTEASGLQVTLPGTYTAAAIAGLISSLDPHASPTNKTIVAGGLQTLFNGIELEQLVLGRVLALEVRQGAIKVVRGITSSTNTAWTQITTRRIVDFARNGTRAAADPFIGKLNNERVRAALKGSINSLLADMIDREMLTAYTLDVTATRDQEIRGIAQVTMVVQPTFSIDYIRVIMYLQ